MRSLIALLLLSLLAGSAAAQRTPAVSVGADFGPAFPLGEFADDGAERGWGVGASAAARLTGLLGVYVSWERAWFDVQADGGAATDGTWTDTGVGAGLRVWFPVGEESRLHPWAQLGIGRHHLDAPIAGPEFAAVDTDGLITVEGGAGVDVAIARQLVFLRPTVRFRRYSFDLDLPGGAVTTRSSYLTLGLGIVVALSPRGGG